VPAVGPPRLGRHVVEQRRLVYRDREFHFVSYDGQPANVKRGQPATAPAWWLMGAGTRWEVAPFWPGQSPEELDRVFTRWLEQHVFCGAPKREPNRRRRGRAVRRKP
jgi:hypothetical protein